MNFRLIIISFFIISTLTGCANLSSNNQNDYFYQKEGFNIALISLHKISILGLIDQTSTLTAKEKEKLTNSVYHSFAQEVDNENLISTNALVKQLSIANYQQLIYAAKESNINKMSEIMHNADANRYLLSIYLTSNVDHGNNNIFDDCSRYGQSITLKMSILDTQNNEIVWNGTVNKSNKQHYCDNDNSTHYDRHDEKDDLAKELVALLIVGLLVNAISEESSNNATKNAQFNNVFKLAIDDFADHLPSFYH